MRLRAIWEKLRASYWFLPTVMTLGAAAFAIGSLAADGRLRYAVARQEGWLYSGGPEGARAVLATIAGSIITVAGTTFSITIAVLSLASGQFGPRLLRNFMRDRGNQAVLGTFTATFVYCLLVLRTVRGTDQETYVPHLSVTIGVLLAVLSLGVLIFFIHHVADSIQVSSLIDRVGAELNDAICRLFPQKLGQENGPAELPGGNPHVVLAASTGYLLEIDEPGLLTVAKRCGLILQLQVRPGDYVIRGTPLAFVWPPGDFQDDAALRKRFEFGRQRTPYQDAEFAFSQLVELAVRALSPGINDPFTAVMCIDRISAALCILADRELPSAYRLDSEKQLRVVVQPYTYERLVCSAFDQIRENGRSQPVVIATIRDRIDRIHSRVRQPAFQLALARQRELLVVEASGSGSKA